jgi:hypothetical protein
LAPAGVRAWFRRRALAVLAALVLAPACAGRPSAKGPHGVVQARGGGDQPLLAAVVREGDPRPAVSVAVLTAGIDRERDPEVAAALAGAVEGRLRRAGYDDAAATPGWFGYRVRILLRSERDAARVGEAIRAALLSPMANDPAALADAAKKVTALRRRPLPDPKALDVARCTGEPFAPPAIRGASAGATHPAGDVVAASILERYRAAAHGGSRVSVGSAGSSALADGVARGLAQGGPWPKVAAASQTFTFAPGAAVVAFDAPELASQTRAPIGARVTVAVRTTRAADAIAVAPELGDPQGALALRLSALDSPAQIERVVATALPDGGCVALTFDLPPDALFDRSTPGRIETRPGDAATRLGSAIALVEEEVEIELAQMRVSNEAARIQVVAAGDPRDAAERAAYWALAGDTRGVNDAVLGTRAAIALPTRRDAVRGAPNGTRAAPPVTPAAAPPTAPGAAAPADASSIAFAESVTQALEIARASFHEPVADARVRVERGQGELWMLLASPCGTAAEGDNDAGVSAIAVHALREAVRAQGDHDVRVEPWVTASGVGLLAHATPRPAESPLGHARRVADVLGRAFSSEPLSPRALARARTELLAAVEAARGTDAFVALAEALAPGRPATVLPLGTPQALARVPDAAVVARLAAFRTGPLRLSVLANVDAAQGSAAARAVDRWLARTPGQVRRCAAVSSVAVPKPGTYAAPRASSVSEAMLAFPLPAGSAAAGRSRALASLVAHALDGPDGLLARALGDTGLALTSEARVLGEDAARALVVRIEAPSEALDAAVAQVRALLERLRKGAFAETDRTRALRAHERAELARALDPRGRLVALFRGELSPDATAATPPAPTPAADVGRTAPSLDAVRAFCASTFDEERMIVVAARPPRAPR